MAVTGVNYAQNNYNNTRGNTTNDLTSTDVFFKILSAELSNQDPLKGKDGTEYVAQLAQFTTLEQTQQLYKAVNNVLMSQSVTEAGMMVGKEVEFAVRDKDGSVKTEKGIVASVKIEGGVVYLKTEDDKTYQLNQSIGFSSVKPVDKHQSITEAGMMIGKQAEFAVKDKDGNVKTEKGIVASVNIKDGVVYLKTTDNKTYEYSQLVAFGDLKSDETPEEKPKNGETDKVDTK